MYTEEEDEKRTLPTREKIHSEIEEILINKLFRVVEDIDVLPTGELNFKPYDDRLLIQLESFLDRKFADKTFRPKRDYQITTFLEQLKLERQKRDMINR
ncbi:MAG: hypothetical protein ACFFDW_05640 [Candidatus Thorarchaeota archaeon]